MREAVLAGEEIEELSPGERTCPFALTLAELARFAKDLLMCNGPGDARNGKREEQQHASLMNE